MMSRENPRETKVNIKGPVHQGAGSVIGTDSSKNKVIVDQSKRSIASRDKSPKSSLLTWLLVSGAVALAVFIASWILMPAIPYQGWYCLGIALLAGIVMLRLNPAFWARSLIGFLSLIVFGGIFIDVTGAIEVSSEHLGEFSGLFKTAQPTAWHYISAAAVILGLIFYEIKRS